MTELISKNDLYKKTENILKRLLDGKTDGEHAFKELFNAIADMPTVEQKHGHWIEELASQHGNTHDGRRWTAFHKYRCSNCQITNGNRRPDFCPHCGAKMDDEVMEDE